MASAPTLPADLLQWVAKTAGAEVIQHRRHSARREAWVLTLRDAAGKEQQLFLRIDRALAAGKVSTRNLERETRLIQALEQHDIPAQKILGWNDRHCAALQSWVPGTGHLQGESAADQKAVMMEFMAIAARMHRIDIDTLALPGFEHPKTALAHSLLEVEAVEEPAIFPVSACLTSPLAAFGKRWLINHAPTDVQATVLVQGDTGPGNFMSEGPRATAIVDWEWAHYGDPMEDLGNIWVRDFFNPSCSGDLTPYFEHYAQCSGFRLQYDSIAYYKVHQLVRSVIGLAYLTEQLDWTTAIPMNLGYRAIIDIETCRAMAELSGRPLLDATPLPDEANGLSLHEATARQIERLVLPQLDDRFTAQLSQGHAATLRYLALRERWQADFDQQELDDLRELLGSGISNLGQGREALIRHIHSLAIADEGPVLDLLYRAAVNQARLMAPLTKPWQQCRWAKFQPRT